jgi:hypothetical protein
MFIAVTMKILLSVKGERTESENELKSGAGMGKVFNCKSRIGASLVLLVGLLLAGPAVSLAAEAVCARVKIKQELTLQRQSFDAHMRINNSIASVTLENVNVDVSFTGNRRSNRRIGGC